MPMDTATHVIRCYTCSSLVRWIYSGVKRWYSCDECGDYGEEPLWDE